MPRDEAGEVRPREDVFAVSDIERGAAAEREEQLPHRGVEAERRELQHSAPRTEAAEDRELPEDERGHPAVLEERPLGTPRRARRVDGVREIVEPGRARRILSRLLRERLGFLVEVERRDGVRAEAIRETTRREERPRAGVLQHVVEAIAGVGRVERDVRRARLEHPERGHHHLRRSVERDPDERVPAEAERAEPVSDLVGARVELGVRDLLVSEHEGDRVRASLDLGFEDVVHARERKSRLRAVPLREDSRPLLRAQQRQLADAGRRIARDALEQAGEVLAPARDRLPVEQVRRVLDLARELAADLPKRPGEVELRRRALGRELLEREIAEDRRRLGGVLQHEHGLEDRRSARIARGLDGLDDPLEQDVAVRERRQRRFPHAREERVERRIAGEIGAKRHCADEEADHRLELGAVTVRERGSDGDVGLTGEPREEHVVRGDEDHEERDAPRARELREDGDEERGREPEGDGGATLRRAGGARAVQREVQRRRPREHVRPVPKRGLRRGDPLGGALPGGVVGVVEGERGEARRRSRRAGRVGDPELAQEDLDRPTVRDDVVERHEERVLVRRETEQPHTQERPLGE